MAFPKLQRRPELDALRGLFLVWMTLQHMPTRIADWVNQPFGYLSSAEGFVFLSALLVARINARLAVEEPGALRVKVWSRARKIYGIHLIMLALCFTIVAGLAIETHRLTIYNLLNFYLAHPLTAIAGSLLLLYCPPLLDILPMYVILLACTPVVLIYAARRGWRVPLAASFLLWLGAQLGLREWVHGAIVAVTHLHIPLQETGAFNIFAWQAVWIGGLWLGASSAAGRSPLRYVNRPLALISAAVCVFFVGVRHSLLGARLSDDALGWWLDKWHIGPLRVLNLFAFAMLFYWLRRFVYPVVQTEPFLTMGKASLEVFCAHLVFVFIALALVYNDVTELHGALALVAVVVTLAGLFLFATELIRRRSTARKNGGPGPGSADPAEEQALAETVAAPDARRHPGARPAGRLAAETFSGQEPTLRP